MKNSKSLSLKKILLAVLAPFVLGTAVVGGTLFGNSAKAFDEDPSTATLTVNDPLYNFDELHYDGDALDDLAEAILSQQPGYTGQKKLANLISYIHSDALRDGLPITNAAITFQYGRYRYNDSDSYHSLIWMPVYMSETADGKDAVLTLYLSTVNGPRSSYEYAPFSNSASSMTNKATVGQNPSNMYGSSYIRAHQSALGNGGTYGTYGSSAGTRNAEAPDVGLYHKYMDFLQYSFKEGDDTLTAKGNLYDDIVAPKDIRWQSNESYSKSIGANVGTIYDVGPVNPVTQLSTTPYSTSGWDNYNWPNDAYGTPSPGGTFYQANKFDYGGGSSSNKKLYSAWSEDKVWLPSLTEVGTTDGNDGLWKLTNDQRSMFLGNDGQSAVPTAWLRTACTAYADTSDSNGDFSVAHMFCVQRDGSIGIRRLNDSYAMSMALRPAIHLNLTAAQKKIKPPVQLGDTVYATYNGAQHRLDSTSVTLTPAQSAWFDKTQMSVRFAYDKGMTKLANPTNAGEYFMEVTLNTGSNLYFVNPSEDNEYKKVVKFVVEKAKLGVQWNMDGNVPTGLDFAPGTTFFPRDEMSGSTPTLGIRFEDYNSGRIYEVEYEELLRGQYTAEAYIVDTGLQCNYELADGMPDPVKINNWFYVGRRVISMPHITGAGDSVSMPYGPPYNKNIDTYTMSYKGNQYILVENVDKYLLVSVASNSGTIECLNPKETVEVNGQKRQFPIVSDNGTLTYRLSDVDTYYFHFEFRNETQFTWEGDYNFNASDGKDVNWNIDTGYLAISLQRSEVTADFVGLPPEWSTIQVQSFTVDLRGLYEHIDGVEVPLSVYYMNDRTADVTTLTAENGVYTLSNLAEGSYTLYAGFVSNDAYDKLYYFPSGTKTQSFKVIQAVSQFDDSLVQWQYTHKGETKAAGKFNDHNAPALAFEFDYDGDDYIFSLTKGEDELRDTYYIKAEYSGDKFVSNAGNYCIKVDIKAYYKNVKVEEKTYLLYFNINPIKYDLSGLEWDYKSENPFTYNGQDHKVRITPESLAKLPGLTAEYSTDGNRIDADSYKTTATFLISTDHANNYVLPELDKENSYEGTFAFSCDWVVNKAKLTIEWLTPENNSFTPKLKNGGEYVTYEYKLKSAGDGAWSPDTVLKADGAAETYQIRAILKPDYLNNYELVNNDPCDFTVESGKLAVTVHFEANGKICNDGDEFKYTGDEVTLELKVDGAATMTDDGYTVEYYQLGAGDARTALNSAPFDVGRYVAVITSSYSAGTYLAENCKSEINFSIIKADYDVNKIFWKYVHGETIVMGRYDPEQGKYVDSDGKEVEFVFEYDGTPHVLSVECQQEFRHDADVLSVYVLTGEVKTNAGNHEATVDFTYNQDRFNNPHDIFPRKLEWTISKKKIDYNEVRWGYISKDGEERVFDFDKDTFRYTRDENGPVGYTVALIGLPNGVQSLFTYTTQLRSVSGMPTVKGNKFAAPGEYLTSFTISGTWSDENHEEFNASTFPLSIHKSRSWTIDKRDLPTLDFNGKWTVFDDRTHDLLELCNIPFTELNYVELDITLNSGLAVFYHYEGYNGVANSLYHAGTYEIILYEKATRIIDGVEVDDLLSYHTLTLNIKKAELEVEWDNKGAYPIAVAKDVLTTDMVTTVYYRANGHIAPIEYVKSTNGEETFTARAKISENYENDITIKMASGQPDHVDFVYSPFKPTENAKPLDKPYLKETEMKYTGSALTFEIVGWGNYSGYLYVANGNLTQTEIGDYKVVIRFFKNADAYWKDGTQETGEYNRDSVTLTFSIIPATEWPLDKPMLEREVEQWTGNDIEIQIVNWVAYSKYLTYEVFFNGESLGDNLKVKRGGIYTIIFRFPENSIGYWKDRPDAPRSDRQLQFRIVGDPEAPTEITYPEFEVYSYEYNGSEIQFKVKNWTTYYSQYLEMNGVGVISIKDGVVTVKNIGTYTINFTFKSDSEYTFVDKKTTYSLTVAVTPPPDDIDKVVPIQKPTLDKTSQAWTGKTLQFSINNWVTIYSKYLDITCDDPSVEIDLRNGIIKVTDIDNYTITLSFKEGAKACWVMPEGSTDPVKLSFSVTGNVGPNKVIKPSLKGGTSKQWTGKDVLFELSNFDPNKVEVVGFTVVNLNGKYYINAGKAIGDYTVTFNLKGDGLSWHDDSTEGFKIDFQITKLQIGDIDVGNDGKPVVKDKDGNIIDVDLGDLLDYKFYDENGNEVDYKDLKPGGKYTVKFEVKDPADFDSKIENGSSIRDLITDKNNKGENGGFVINNYQPAQSSNNGEKDSGFNPLWWIAIVAAILAVIAVIGLIIGLATRNNNGGGYDDGYGYDDYDDYDDDDDDDDDDYDDYDDDYYDDY